MAEHILAGPSPVPSNATIIHTAATMSRASGGSFTALFVRTPNYAAMSGNQPAGTILTFSIPTGEAEVHE